MARKYQAIWQRLKNSSTLACTVEVHRLIVARVVKAVIKEKDMDVAFKLANEKSPLRLTVERIPLADKRHVRIEFKLKQRYGGLADVKKELSTADL